MRRIFLGALLGAVAHTTLVTVALVVAGTVLEPGKSGELAAWAFIGAVVTSPVGGVLGAVAGRLSARLAPARLATVGAGLGVAGGLLVSLAIASGGANLGLVPVIVGLGALNGAVLMAVVGKLLEPKR